MPSPNPYEPPRTDPELAEPKWPVIAVDGSRLVVASGAVLPRRCIKTNQPTTEHDSIHTTLQYPGRTFQLTLVPPECEITWFASPTVRWRSRFQKPLGGLLILLTFLVVFTDELQARVPVLPAAFLIAICGLTLFLVGDQKLKIVDYKHDRFWIEGCSREFLRALDLELDNRGVMP